MRSTMRSAVTTIAIVALSSMMLALGVLAPAQAATLDITGPWPIGATTVQVSPSGGGYIGVLNGPMYFGSSTACSLPIGTKYWTMSPESGNTYIGTMTWVDTALGACDVISVKAKFVFTSLDPPGIEVSTSRQQVVVNVPVAQPITSIRTVSKANPPTVKARNLTKEPGRTNTVEYSVDAKSGQATVHWALYSDGVIAREGESDGLVTAKGQKRTLVIRPSSSFPGPYYLCISAIDSQGTKSANWPCSAWAWLSLEVPLDSRISNGCGGSGLPGVPVEAQNWWADTKQYTDRQHEYTVNFRSACNVHDAAYSGLTFKDPFSGKDSGKVIDFRRWSRKAIDEKFLTNLVSLCRKTIDRQAALDQCEGLLGAKRLYELVREFAKTAYDADATTPGDQDVSPASTWPPGGGRNNA
ncbi:MAG: hypothetical protein WC005_07950 [Candidatus Nanopelagicales bacterium]